MDRISDTRLAELEELAECDPVLHDKNTVEIKRTVDDVSTFISAVEWRELLRAYRTPTGLDREGVARIIDPEAWALCDQLFYDPYTREERDAGRKAAGMPTSIELVASSSAKASEIIALSVVASPPEPEAKTGGAEAWPHPDWKCPDCRCRSYSHFDEPDGHGGFRKSGNIRCHNCKRDWYAPSPAPAVGVDGWRWVPVEITPEMADAFGVEFNKPAPKQEAPTNTLDRMRLLAGNVYRATIAASPALSTSPLAKGDG